VSIIDQANGHELRLVPRVGATIHELVARTPLRTVMVVAILSRLFVFVVAVAANYVFGVNPTCNSFGCWSIDLPFFNLLSRWDSGFYADIALHGYGNQIVAKWEFFPMYPILMGIFGRLLAATSPLPLDLAVHVAGFALSNLFFLAAVYFLYRLSEGILRQTSLAFESALFLAIYPAGVFLSATYSESLFLVLTLSSLYYWYVKRMGKSGVLGFLAALTRPVGVILAVPYLYELLFNSVNRRSPRMYLPILGVLLGYLSFMAYSQLMTGTPFANFDAARLYWKVAPDPIAILTLARREIFDHPIIVPYLVLGVGGVLASLATARSQAEKAIGLYAICLIASYLPTPIISFPRYSITLVPMYWGLSKLSRWPLVRGLMYAIFLVLLAIGTGLFVNWYSFY